MRVQQLDVDQREAAGRERPLRGEHRVVLEMLVVDRVELGALDQREQVLHLDRHPAVVRDQRAQTLGEPDDVRDVGVDVVRRRRARPGRARPHLRAGLRRRGTPSASAHPSPGPPRRRSPTARSPGSGCRGRRRAAAGSRRCWRPRPRTSPAPSPSRSTAPSTNRRACSTQLVGERREVGVLGERLLRSDQRRQLRQQAALAHPHVQRVRRSPAARAPPRAGTAHTAASRPGPGSCAARVDPHNRQVSAGSVVAAAVRGAVSVSIRGILRSGRPPPRARLSARARSVPRTPDSSVRGRGRGRLPCRSDERSPPGRRAASARPVRARSRPVVTLRRRRLSARGGSAPASRCGRRHGTMERPVRRGVTAAPRILVPMVQVRILAAERQVRMGAHDRGTRVDSAGDSNGSTRSARRRDGRGRHAGCRRSRGRRRSSSSRSRCARRSPSRPGDAPRERAAG